MSNVKLSAKWQLDAALLSRPVDLTALVSLSKKDPESFIEEDRDKNGQSKGNTLYRLINTLLNEKNTNKADKDTKLDVLNILANVALKNKACRSEVRSALGGVSEWFDEYLKSEEGEDTREPELHKAMVLLLARCWEYSLKTEDVLELTGGDRKMALCTVVGLLEDGETYSTTLKQRQRPGQGQMGQWEHELVVQRYEKPLVLQVCRLLRGFTHPSTYFESHGDEIALYSVEKFAMEMDGLLEITLHSRLVDKLSWSLSDCLFGDNEEALNLEESDHLAVSCVNAFLQNLYFYASNNVEEYRQHLLVDTQLVPQLILPYIECCVSQLLPLCSRSEAYGYLLGQGDPSPSLLLQRPQLARGLGSSLRSLVIASFRPPCTRGIAQRLRSLNPTPLLLRAKNFLVENESLFAMTCLLNVNMGALDLSRPVSEQSDHLLLHELSKIFTSMSEDKQTKVLRRVVSSGTLPIARDTPSYTAVMSVLLGGSAGQLTYASQLYNRLYGEDGTSLGGVEGHPGYTNNVSDDTDAEPATSRQEFKRDFADRMKYWTGRMKEIDDNSNNSGSDAKGDQTQGHGAIDSYTNLQRLNNVQSGNVDSDTSFEAESKNAEVDRLDAKPGRTGFEIACAIANQSKQREREAKDDPNPSNPSNPNPTLEGRYRLLGELPSLKRDKHDMKIALSLELPDDSIKHKFHFNNLNNNNNNNNNNSNKSANTNNSNNSNNSNNNKKDSNNNSNSSNDDPPKEFLCAINGHIMKDPVRDTKTGMHFERETINIWLHTRGSVNPITMQPLDKQDLVFDPELKNRIKRYHIQQTALKSEFKTDDDLYDF